MLFSKYSMFKRSVIIWNILHDDGCLSDVRQAIGNFCLRFVSKGIREGRHQQILSASFGWSFDDAIGQVCIRHRWEKCVCFQRTQLKPQRITCGLILKHTCNGNSSRAGKSRGVSEFTSIAHLFALFGATSVLCMQLIHRPDHYLSQHSCEDRKGSDAADAVQVPDKAQRARSKRMRASPSQRQKPKADCLRHDPHNLTFKTLT